MSVAMALMLFTVLNFSPFIERFGDRYTFSDLLRLGPSLYWINLAMLNLIVLGMMWTLARRFCPFPASTISNVEVYVDAKYKILGGNQGAVGDDASASQFAQSSHASPAAVELSLLATELSLLRPHLIASASQPEHYIAVAAVANAEQAAREGNESSSLDHLRRAGKWIWDVATKVGIGVATEAAKRAIGV